MVQISIITTAHWAGDPRLNRHRTYLVANGHAVDVISFADEPRWKAVWKACRVVNAVAADVVVLPDPEMFFIGSGLARARNRVAVIDIHEDYPEVVAGRSWVPVYLRPFVSLVARAAIRLGRRVASKVMVAAPQLAEPGDVVVLNLPDPASMRAATTGPRLRIVYVGDLTVARGATDMVEILSHLDDRFELLLIGRADAETRAAIVTAADDAGVSSRVELTGRLDHGAAWDRARDSLVGLSFLRGLPAYREAVATKIWEYMGCGLPPVVSDLPGQRSLVSRISEDLVCVSPADAATCIRKLADDTEMWRVLVARGRQTVEDEWAANRPDLAVQAIVEP